jgi:hypothetical protein
MVEDAALKFIARSRRMAYLPTKYHEDLPSSSKVISGGHADRLEN